MRGAGWFAILLASVLVVPSGPSIAEDEAAGPIRRALLIGINDYAANDDPASTSLDWIPLDLHGALNDVERMRALLTSRFGFEDDDIRTLKDGDATREAILAAMRGIVRDSRAGDVVYLHFSGHGSQVPDTDGDEKDDGLDETILPHDARTGEIPDITDDEIGEILSGLQTRNALVVLDSCHSGTATRDVSSIRTRMVRADPRTQLYEKQVTTRAVGSTDRRYVLMTGAAEHQSALDGPIDGKYYGFFSYALGKALANAAAGTTPLEVHAAVLKEFERLATQFGLYGMPQPQLEGPPSLTARAMFLSTDTRLAWAKVRSLGAGIAVLEHAVPLGASAGALWAVYPPGETEFRPGAALATATVIGTAEGDARARLEPADPPPPVGARAVAVAHPPASERVPIRLDRVDPTMRVDLENAIREQSSHVQFATDDEFARFIIDVENGGARVFGAGGLQQVASFPAETAEAAATGIAEVLNRSVSASSLLSLDNPAAALQLDVRVASSGVDRATRGVKVVAASDAPAYRMRRRGQARSAENSLMLELNADRDCYVTVVDVDTEGGINVLFPNAQMKEGFYPKGRIPGGRTVRLPDSLQAGNRAGFHWDYGPPAGLDTVRVFAMTDLDSARKLRTFIAGLGPRVATRSVAGVLPTFGNLARDLVPVVATRGIAVVADDDEPGPTENGTRETSTAGPDWTAVSMTFVIEE